jgi:flagellar biosynthesis protein FlhG
METGIPRLYFIPATPCSGHGEHGVLHEAEDTPGLAALPADYVLMDLGAGSSYNIVDFS